MSSEKFLLRSVLDENNVPIFLKIDPEIFPENEKSIYRVIKEFLDRYGTLPNQSTLRNNGIDLSDFDPAECSAYYLDLCIKRAKRVLLGALLSSCNRIVHGDSVEEAEMLALDFVAKCRKLKPSDSIDTLYSISKNVIADYVNVSNFGDVGSIFLGVPTIDEATKGLQSSDVVVLAARPSVGKSMILIRWCMNVSMQGKKCLFISMEMGKDQVVRRMIGMDTGINPNNIRSGKVSCFNQRKLLHSQYMYEGRKPIFVESGDNIRSVDDIRRSIELIKPDMVFADALYLCKQSKNFKSNSKWESVSNVVEEFKGILEQYGIPGAATYQLSREAEKTSKKNRQEELRDNLSLDKIHLSDSIGQIGSVIIGMLPDTPPNNITRRFFRFLKNREGEVPEFTCNYRCDTMDFSEVSVDRPMEETGSFDSML